MNLFPGSVSRGECKYCSKLNSELRDLKARISANFVTTVASLPVRRQDQRQRSGHYFIEETFEVIFI
jgi:hypothetical protein